MDLNSVSRRYDAKDACCKRQLTRLTVIATGRHNDSGRLCIQLKRFQTMVTGTMLAMVVFSWALSKVLLTKGTYVRLERVCPR